MYAIKAKQVDIVKYLVQKREITLDSKNKVRTVIWIKAE